MLIAVSVSFILALHPIFNYDIFWHLAYGREMARLGEVVSADFLSLAHHGTTFVNREWAAQWMFYLLQDSLGWVGLLGFKLLVACGVTVLCFRTALFYGSRTWLAASFSAIVVLTGLQRYFERPELFTLFFVALLMYLIAGWQTRKHDARLLYLMPPIMLVWDWLHGGIFGLVILSVVVSLHTREALAAGERGKPWARHFLFACAVTLLVMAINPYGLRTYAEFLGHLSSLGATWNIMWGKFTGAAIDASAAALNQEYRAPLGIFFLPFYVFLAVALVAPALGAVKLPKANLLIALGFGLGACLISRIIAVFAIVTGPLLAAYISSALDRGEARRNITLGLLILLALVLVPYASWLKFWGPSNPKSFGWTLDEQYLPAGAVAFYQAHDLAGNFYNTGHVGGYLAWRLYPEHRIFQYNHGAIFGDTYRYVFNPTLIEPYDFRFAFVADPLELTRLFPISAWARIYRDTGVVLAARRSEENRELIERFELLAFHPMMTTVQLERAGQIHGPRLLEEMTNYLAFLRDDRIASTWCRLAGRDLAMLEKMRLRDELIRAVRMNPTIGGDCPQLLQAIPASGAAHSR